MVKENIKCKYVKMSIVQRGKLCRIFEKEMKFFDTFKRFE